MKRFPTYEDIKTNSTHSKTKQLIDYVLEKKSNLCCAADVLSAKDLLQLADEVGEHIVLLKIHVDTLPDFSIGFLYKLQELAKKHKFLIFEDRKIADIGFVAQQQLLSGVHKIANQADLVNVHAIAGESSIKALKEAGKSCGIILVCEMSTNDTLTNKEYVNSALSIADEYQDVVVGIVAQNHRPKNIGQLLFTPGINMSVDGDNMGQNYNNPEYAILECGVDIIIVGRGITKSDNPKKTAELYKQIGQGFYIKKISIT